MRKYNQEQILELIQTLYEATDEIKRFLSRKDIDSVMQLLADCQEMAIRIGNYIERLEGEGTQTVSRLEEYCQLLYQANVELNDTGSDIKIAKQLQKQLIKIENSVKDELRPNKIEIVFISYKASMSDSIESIYLAAKADPCCDAFFIPIPYYNINPDNSLGTMNYEGADCYGDNIEITDWQKYDIEARHPDVIFTFNPYDEGNLVTRIHPDFFCRKLRESTDLLVYVPYFVASDDIPEHFCTTAGCIYAHKVIVQSEKIRDIYIRAFQKTFGDRFGKVKDRFVALGSPKFDMVLNTKREDCILPDEWTRLINGKKVVLYNTSIGAILNGGEQYLKKLRHVLSVFQKRDDVVLWWRPHPLSEATYASMRPGLLEEYRAIVADYKHRENSPAGIFDQSPDLHHALAYADAMVSDNSSVAAMFQVTGKPLLMQKPEYDYSLDKETQEEYLHSDIIILGSHLLTIEECASIYPEWHECWLPNKNILQNSRFILTSDCEFGISRFLNAIYNIDEESRTAQCLMSFSGDNKLPWQYQSLIRIKNRLLFTPSKARCWAFYDLESFEWTYKEIPKDFHPSNEHRMVFGGYVVFENELIFMPGESGAIAKYNIDTGKITYHKEWYSKFRSNVTNVVWGIINGVLVYHDSLLLISPQANVIIEIDPKTVSVKKLHKVGDYNLGFKTAILVPNTDTIFLIKFREPGKTPWIETIIKWNIKSGDVKEIMNLPLNPIENHTQNFLCKFVFWKGELFSIPLQSDSVLKIDLQTDKVIRFPLTPEFDFFERKSKYYEGWGKDQAMPYLVFNCKRMKYMAQLPYDYGLADIDFSNGKVSNRRKWSVEGIEDLLKTKSLLEGPFNTLENFLDQLDSDECLLACKNRFDRNCEQIGNADGKSGLEIFEYVKKLAGV